MYVKNENNTTYFTIMIVFITDGIYNTFFFINIRKQKRWNQFTKTK